MKKNLAIIVIFLSIGKVSISQQTTFDITDSLVNLQKQFIIKFDVSNGDIYVPVRKNIKENKKVNDYFKIFPFTYKLDTISKKIEKIIKTTTITNSKMSDNVDTIYSYDIKQGNAILKYLKAGKFFKPKVGSFIRLIFQNIPKGMDIGVSADFFDKNLENASAAQGFLNNYMMPLDSAVNHEIDKETKKIIRKQTDEVEMTRDTTKKLINDTIQPKLITVTEELKKINGEFKNLTGLNETGDRLKSNILILLEEADKIIKQVPKSLNDSLPKDFTADSVKVKLDSIHRLANQIDKVPAGLLRSIDQSSKIITPELQGLEIKTSELLTIQKESHEKIDSLSRQLEKIIDSISHRHTICIQPIQVANKDVTLLKITYKTIADRSKDVYREIMFKNKYGFKMDFSTGFIGTGLKDDNYRIVPRPKIVSSDADSTLIKADPKGSFAIGFGLLAHAYIRTGERVNLAINSGLMLNGSNQTINYLLGGSLALGLEQRFIISGGLAFGKVKRLTTGYEVEKSYNVSELSIAAGVPYTEQWHKSWYIGISYNIGSLTSSSRTTIIAR